MFDCIDVIGDCGKNAFALIEGVFQALRENKDAASTIESAAKVMALVVGGWWTWKAYVRKRILFPSAKVEHVISYWTEAEIKFLRVTLRMTNNGNVLIPIGEGCTWIQQVTPVPQQIYDAVAGGEDPVQPNTTEFGWTQIGERKLNPMEGFEIEPGEAEEFHFDFTVHQGVSRVLVYSYLENSTKGRWWKTKRIGWQVSTVYEIPKPRKGIREWLTKNL